MFAYPMPMAGMACPVLSLSVSMVACVVRGPSLPTHLSLVWYI